MSIGRWRCSPGWSPPFIWSGRSASVRVFASIARAGVRRPGVVPVLCLAGSVCDAARRLGRESAFCSPCGSRRAVSTSHVWCVEVPCREISPSRPSAGMVGGGAAGDALRGMNGRPMRRRLRRHRYDHRGDGASCRSWPSAWLLASVFVRFRPSALRRNFADGDGDRGGAGRCRGSFCSFSCRERGAGFAYEASPPRFCPEAGPQEGVVPGCHRRCFTIVVPRRRCRRRCICCWLGAAG